MSAVIIYRSSDTSAPVLTGEAGTLVNLLDKVLVAGYGSKAAAGWTKPYVGTNSAAFRSGGGNQYYLNVDDNGPGAGTYKEARVRGYETMTAVSTGTNLFPTAAQMTNGLFARKSATLDATARVWTCVADDRTFYLYVSTGDIASTYFNLSFGDMYSFKTSDVGRTFIHARTTENSAAANVENFDNQSMQGTAQSGSYLARDTANNVGAIQFGKLGSQSFITAPGGSTLFVGNLAFKNVSDNRIYLAPIMVHQIVGGNHFRGRLRGLWHFGHALTNASDGDTFSGVGDLSGKSFMVLRNTANTGMIVIETSTTWDTN